MRCTVRTATPIRKAQLRKDSFLRNRANAKPSPKVFKDCKA
jgi:hypothetical protein